MTHNVDSELGFPLILNTLTVSDSMINDPELLRLKPLLEGLESSPLTIQSNKGRGSRPVT